MTANLPFEFNSADDRLVASDWCEDNGQLGLATLLRETHKPLLLRGLSVFHHPTTISPAENEAVKKIKKAIGSSKRHLQLRCAPDPVYLSGRYWDEGSITTYARIHLYEKGEKDYFAHVYPQSSPGIHPSGQETWVPCKGEVLVEYGFFQGKPTTPIIYFYEEDAAIFGLTWVPGF